MSLYTAFRYVNVEYQCHFRLPVSSIEHAVVSLVMSEENNYMKLRQYFREGIKHNFTVCLGGPWRGNPSPKWFVEWMEANLMMGASMVMIHNMSVSSKMDSYVSHYVKRGLLEVYPWDFDQVMLSANNNVQQTIFSNCFYRMRRRSRYMAQIDHDELIVPRYPGTMTWAGMIKHSGCAPDVHEYGARQLFYGMSYGYNREHSNDTGMFFIDAKQRSKIILKYTIRSKYMVNTFVATVLYNHYAAGPKSSPGCVMPIEVGASHHYRTQSLNLAPGLVVDNSTHKYKDILGQRIRKTMKDIT